MSRTKFLLSFLVLAGSAPCQSVLFQEDFDGSVPAFTLNTMDQVSAIGGANTWLVNEVYAGGDGTADCLGFELPFTIPATAGQPVGLPGANGNYLHTASTAAVTSGILNCSFGAADGFCTDPGNHFARMSTDVSTTGQSNVSFSFWWLCQGGTANYGEVYYSTDGGTQWTLITTPIAQYRNQPAWIEQTISLPAFGGQPTLRFGFRFVNGTSLFGAADPGFGVDAIRISSSEAVPTTITTGALDTYLFCAGSSFELPFAAEGTFTAGNVFSAELSDPSGTFIAPTVIGAITSTSAGIISCTLPAGTPAGSAYRVRVIGSAPQIIGAAIGSDISIVQPTSAGDDNEYAYCEGGIAVALIDILGGTPAACGVWIGPNGDQVNGIFTPGVDPSGTYVYTTDCAPPCPADQASVTMIESNSQGAGSDVVASICSDGSAFTPYAYIDGGITTGQFLFQGQPFPLPDFTVPGTYALTYVVQGTTCGNDTAQFEFNVVAPPNAGTDLSYTVCVNASPVELVTLLVGAQSGGSWTGPSGSAFNGTLVPGSDVSGLYTYTVAGDAPCPEDQAFVALVIDPCSGIPVAEALSDQLRWLGAQGHVHVFRSSIPFHVRSIELFDAQGRSVPTRPIDQRGERMEMDLGGVDPGIYLARFITLEGNAVIRLIQP